MRDDLFFVPIVAAALEEPDTAAALGKTFWKIKRTGCKPRYRRGYRQFLGWIDALGNWRQHGVPRPLTADACRFLRRPLSMNLVLEKEGTRLAVSP